MKFAKIIMEVESRYDLLPLWKLETSIRLEFT